LLAPPLERGVTRFQLMVRPFVTLSGQGGGAITDIGVDHYLARLPLKLSLGVTPLAFALESRAGGAITHVRVGAAYAADYVEVGLAAGLRWQDNGPPGWSFAGTLRLGALDGLRLTAIYGYVLTRNYYTDRPTLAASHARGEIAVPVHRQITLVLAAGASYDAWLYADIGVQHRLARHGVLSPWTVRGALGFAWILDRFPCRYEDPRPCRESAWGVGPTIGFGVERRF
jgi:hypothetical protein